MVTTHQRLLARVGPPPVPSALLDTPYGFQTNADELSQKAVAYFRDSVGHDLGIASLRASGAPSYDEAIARLREARYVFAGPGSPSYALEQWKGSLVPDVLAGMLRRGGALVFASAAALTLGAYTLPVYEIYKVGVSPHWLEGLDLLADAGLRAALIPHYDNAEGGTHDTRYCYMGEERLTALEAMLPPGCIILGVDEHTSLVLDLDDGTATIAGRGGVTIRVGGTSRIIPAGETVPIGSLADPGDRTLQQSGRTATTLLQTSARSPVLDAVDRAEVTFAAALEARDGAGATAAILELDRLLEEWRHETFSGDEAQRARVALRAMVLRLGTRAEAVVPLVDAMLGLRRELRAAEHFELADLVRDALASAGVDVRDTAEGTTWTL
jgi:hypothetical protein